MKAQALGQAEEHASPAATRMQEVSASAVIAALRDVTRAIERERFRAPKKHARTVLLHCGAAISAIEAHGLTEATHSLALRALYPSIDRVERDLVPIVLALLAFGIEPVGGERGMTNNPPRMAGQRMAFAIA